MPRAAAPRSSTCSGLAFSARPDESAAGVPRRPAASFHGVQRMQGAHTTLQSGPRLHGLQSVLQTLGSTHTPNVPANERLIGPGRSSTVSISGLPDDAAQMLPAN